VNDRYFAYFLKKKVMELTVEEVTVDYIGEHLEENNVYIEFSKISELKDGTEYIIFNSIPKKY